MERDIVQTFLTVVEEHSVTRAAEILFVSQPTVSHRLQLLEKDLGVKLFERDRGFRNIEITQAGRAFIPLAEQWIELDDTIHKNVNNDLLGRLIIGSMDSLNGFLINDILSEIVKKNRNMSFRFISYHSQQIYSALSSGVIDVAFAFRPIHYDVQAMPVFKEPMYMICSKNSIYPEGPVHPFQLKKENEVFFQWNPQIRKWNDEWWSESISPYTWVDSTALLRTFLTNPATWAIAPLTVAESFEAEGIIKKHEFSVEPPYRTCYMLIKSSSESDSIRKFESEFFRLWQNHPLKTLNSDIEF